VYPLPPLVRVLPYTPITAVAAAGEKMPYGLGVTTVIDPVPDDSPIRLAVEVPISALPEPFTRMPVHGPALVLE